ncbi:MAG: threonine--tRNA ligase, partial [Nanoarchaeota archaeon]|nr:threonine--tRNA ligase [Nanoarchaeota archaeon]
VEDIAKQVKAKDVVLYPYAHLSNNLSAPDVASEVLEKAEKELGKSFKVVKAPFGYYKEFELKVKGHPLSELSRSFGSGSAHPGKVIVGNDEDYDVKHLLREISKSKLDTSKLKENDHRILGRQMDLFSFSDVAPGMVFWHNNGLIIYNGLVDFWREKHKGNYQEIRTPQIMDSKLWKVSGHWDKYKENNFVTDYEDRPFLVKPMNCPGGMLVYKSSPKSYKDLPLRVGEMGTVHRCELSGVLAGLFRVIQFTQDDAHIFCTEAQVKDEIKGVIELVKEFYKIFKLDFDHIELSTRPEKRIGSDKEWDMAEKILEEVLKENKVKYKINEGDGAFYGPKIDFHVKDSLGRTWQLSTIQLDFALPERFDLEYIDKDNKRKRPIMLHRVIYGSLERFAGILLEHTGGRLPTWLAPIQVRVVSFTDRNEKYAKKIVETLASQIPNLRIDADLRNTTVQAKVKEAELMRIPYIIVVGEREEKSNSVALRVRGDKKIKTAKIEKFAKDLGKEILERR